MRGQLLIRNPSKNLLLQVQAAQAEGLKFGIEMCRRKKWGCSGVMLEMERTMARGFMGGPSL